MGFFSKLFGRNRRQPEDDFKITISNTSIKVEHPRRKTEEVRIAGIVEIKLINTDTGPAALDLWLALIGEGDGCLIPHGAEGFEEVFDIITAFEGFNLENFIAAMACTENAEFELWKK